MKIVPICVFKDNYIWLIIEGNQAICIDPGQSAPVLSYLKEQQLNLQAIWLTHQHEDHIGGVTRIKDQWSEAIVYGKKAWNVVDEEVKEASQINALTTHAKVWSIPGHTNDHLAYLVMIDSVAHVFCGDTLFSAGCGRVFTGTMNELYHSIQRLAALPMNSLFYPAHEYTHANLLFAHTVEPENQDIDRALIASEHIPTLPVTLQHELKINPFLRLNEIAIHDSLQKNGLISQKDKDPLIIFSCLRTWKNHFL